MNHNPQEQPHQQQWQKQLCQLQPRQFGINFRFPNYRVKVFHFMPSVVF